MNTLKRAREIYRNDGTIPLIKSGGKFVGHEILSPIGNQIYKNSKKIRYDDIASGEIVNELIQIDNREDGDVSYDIPFGLEASDNSFRYLPRYSFRDQYVAEFENIRLLGPDAIPVTPEQEIICEAIEPSDENGYRLKQSIQRSVSDSDILKSYISNKTKNFDCVCSLTSNWNNYYHWILEHLPKLRAVEIANREWDIDVVPLIPPNPPDYVRESLKLMGYDNNDYIEWEGGIAHTSSYIQPTFTEPTKQICQWLRERALSNISNNSPQHNPNRIYISRKKASNRKFQNERQVESLLHNFGFETYTTEDLCVPEQVSLFCNAEIILSAHGAGLTDMVWGEDITVIEIFNEVIKPPYFQIARELGHSYYPLQASAVNNKGYNSDMEVNITELGELLEDVVA